MSWPPPMPPAGVTRKAPKANRKPVRCAHCGEHRRAAWVLHSVGYVLKMSGWVARGAHWLLCSDECADAWEAMWWGEMDEVEPG